MRVAELLASLRLIGFGNGARSVHNAVDRTWRDRRSTPRPQRAFRAPGELRSAASAPGGGVFEFGSDGHAPKAGGASLRVCLLAGGGVFVAWDGAEPTPSYALADPETTPEPDPTSRLYQLDDDWVVQNDGLAVRVGRRGGLEVREGLDTPVLRYDAPPWWNGPAWAHRSFVDQTPGNPTPGDRAAVFGLGGRSGRLDRTGGRFRLWNSEPGGSYGPATDPLSITMPVYLVVADGSGQLAFYDTTYDGTVDVGRGAVTVRMIGGALRYYVFPGSPEEALERYTGLTGRPALPPRWALGYHQSRWGYGSEAVLRDIVAGFESLGLPLSGLWLDIDHLSGHRTLTVDRTRFPDLPGFAAELAESDRHLVAVVDPGVKHEPGLDLYESGRALGAFCTTSRGRVARGVCWPGPIVFPDFTAARVRRWWGDQYTQLADDGVDGVWHDMNEPSSFTAFGEPTLPRSTRHDLDGRGGDHSEAHNLYGLLMDRAGYEGLRRLRPDRRPYLISRSGWAGLQRYGGTWSGDVETSWGGLRASLAFTLGLGLCGVPYSGPDIGGFTAHPAPELYVRWFQLAAHLPFFRTHCARSLPPREPWEHGTDVLAAVAAQLRERYRLLPYWYTLAWQAHRTGAPYVRPLCWADPADTALREIDDAFLLGDALLVAPVLEEGAREREVRLPAGRWVDRRDGVAYDGPATVRLAAPPAEIPVLARAGAILPVEEERRIVLEAYAAAPGAEPVGGTLVTDEGDGYAEPREERFTVDRDGRALTYEGPADELPYEVRWLP